jgi:hypothetical protein
MQSLNMWGGLLWELPSLLHSEFLSECEESVRQKRHLIFP